MRDGMGAREQEASLQKQFMLVPGGRAEVITPVGMIDILTETEIIEIKTWGEWKSAIGQILSYGFYFPDHAKRIHLFAIPEKFGARSSNLLREIVSITESLGIRVTLQMRDGRHRRAEELCDDLSSVGSAGNLDAVAQIDRLQAELASIRARLAAM